jgi:hypothetical protein
MNVRPTLTAVWALAAAPGIGWAAAFAGGTFVSLLVLPPALAAAGAVVARSRARTTAGYAAGALTVTLATLAVAVVATPGFQ